MRTHKLIWIITAVIVAAAVLVVIVRTPGPSNGSPPLTDPSQEQANLLIKTMLACLDDDPQAKLLIEERRFIDQSLAAAWRSAQQKYGPDPHAWRDKAVDALASQRLGYYESLHGFPELHASWTVPMPSLTRIDAGTIGCQTSQAYTQWVPLDNPDGALSILPVGQSEWPNHPSRTATLTLWEQGGLHPAPLSRAAVEAL